jgi:hypothetical protein
MKFMITNVTVEDVRLHSNTSTNEISTLEGMGNVDVQPGWTQCQSGYFIPISFAENILLHVFIAPDISGKKFLNLWVLKSSRLGQPDQSVWPYQLVSGKGRVFSPKSK